MDFKWDLPYGRTWEDVDGLTFLSSGMSRHLDPIGGMSASFSVAQSEGLWKPDAGRIHLYQSRFYWCQQTFTNVQSNSDVLNTTNSPTTVPLKPLHKKTKLPASPSSADGSIRDDPPQFHTTLTYSAEDDAQRQYTMIEAISEEIITAFAQVLYVRSMAVELDQIGAAAMDSAQPIGLNILVPFDDYLANTDLQTFTSNIAASVSTQMRAKNPGDNANLTLIPGDVFVNEAYIQVHWPWLTLFVVETLMATGLLALTIMMTKDEPLYKSSALALLKHRIPGWEEDGSSSKVSIKRGSQVVDYEVEVKQSVIEVRDTEKRLKDSARDVLVQFDRGSAGETIITTRARAK